MILLMHRHEFSNKQGIILKIKDKGNNALVIHLMISCTVDTKKVNILLLLIRVVTLKNNYMKLASGVCYYVLIMNRNNFMRITLLTLIIPKPTIYNLNTFYGTAQP